MSYKKIELISPTDVRRPEKGYIYLGHDSSGLWRKYPDNTYDYIQSGTTTGSGGSYWSIDPSNNLYYTLGRVFVGTTPYTPSERFVVDGAITIGNASYNIGGTIKYTSNKFYGYNGSTWLEFGSGTTGSGGSSYWESNAYGIYYGSGKVYIGGAISATALDPSLSIQGNAIMKGTSSLYFDSTDHYIKADTSNNLLFRTSTNFIFQVGSSESWNLTTSSIYNTSTTAYLGSNTYKFGAIYAKNLEMIDTTPEIYMESKSSSSSNCSYLRMVKGYNVSDGDSLGKIEWYGDPSSSASALIEAVAGETFSPTNVATTLKFMTANTSSASPATRLYIDPNGYVGINRGEAECEAELHVNGITKSNKVYASSGYRVDDGTTKNGITQSLTIDNTVAPPIKMDIVGGIIVFYGQYIPA